MPVHQVTPPLFTMGEDRFKTNGTSVDKKSNGMDSSCAFRNGDHSVPHSSTMSTCSEVDSETTSFVNENNDHGEYQYGPGIVSKLRTKYMSIALKQNRGVNRGMRRSCSLENILDQKTTTRSNVNHGYAPPNRFVCNGSSNGTSAPWTTLKRAKSMDTLLTTIEKELQDAADAAEADKLCSEPKLIRRTDGRAAVLITEEEFPKPDTVKTYKRMFEPAESKKTNSSSNVRRRPPVLRATAKSGTTSNKMNGIASHKLLTKSITSAKELPKETSKPEPINLVSVSKEVDELNKKNTSSSVDRLSKRTYSSPVNILNKTNASSPSNISSKRNFNLPVDVLSKKSATESPAKNSCSPVDDPSKKVSISSAVNKQNLNSPVDVAYKNIVTSSTDGVCKNNLNHPLADTAAKRNLASVENAQRKTDEPPVLSQCKMTLNSPVPVDPPTKNIEVVNPDLACNGTVRAEAIHIKVKDEIAKRNLRSPSKTNGVKPSPPLRKPTTKLSVIESKDCKSRPVISEKPIVFQKPTLKCSNGPTKTQAPAKKVEPPKVVEPKPQAESVSIKNDPPCVAKKDVSPTKPLVNGLSKPDVFQETKAKPVPNKSQPHTGGPKRIAPPSNGQHNSMVFDFRGKDVVAHVTVSPAPFGCKPALVRKRSVLIDGKESAPHLNGLGSGGGDSEDEDYVDYSVPGPCGLVFEGENIKVGKGAILSTRNKDLKIKFDEDVEKSTFVYPSETSLISDDSSLTSTSSSDSSDSPMPIEIPRITNSPKLPANTAVNSGSGGLMTYTPSVLRTVDNFQPGLFRAPEEKKKNGTTVGEEENRQATSQNIAEGQVSMLKPADPEYISSWSLSAGTSDLLF